MLIVRLVIGVLGVLVNTRLPLDNDRDVSLAGDAVPPKVIFSVPPGNEWPNLIPCGVHHLHALILLVPLPSPFGTFPAAEVLNLPICQTQRIESIEETLVVLEAAETHAVRPVSVVEARIASLGAVQVAVERCDFYAYFGHEIAGQMSGKRRRVCWRRMWKEVIVQQVRYGCLATHCNGLGLVGGGVSDKRSVRLDGDVLLAAIRTAGVQILQVVHVAKNGRGKEDSEGQEEQRRRKAQGEWTSAL